MRLKDKVAIVTGAASELGIGYGIATAFAKEGAKVVLCDIKESVQQRAAEIDKTGQKAMALKIDVSKESDVLHMIKATVDKFGKLDILANNAGTLIQKPTVDMTVEEWDQVVDTNLKGVFLGAKHAVPEMIKQGKGRIINTASVAAFRVTGERLCSYNASKAGIVGLTFTLAYEFGPKKITVNAVAPGAIETEINRNFFAEPMFGQQGFLLTRCLCGRHGRPSDIANAFVFLASDESEFITGQTIIVDSGWLTF